MITTTTRNRLNRAARSAGLKVSRNGLLGPRGGKADWTIGQDQLGWLTIMRPAKSTLQDLVVAHAEWTGPVNLIATGDGPVLRIDVYLGNQFTGQFDPVLNPAGEEDFERILANLLEQAVHLFCQNLVLLEEWEPPETSQLVAWLAEAGHPVAKDQQENLRMTIRASGRDGQVRVLCRRGQLRLTMPLGSWSRLDPTAETAMLRLADQANTHLRLARIAWRTEAETCRCEAQVDLTGLVPRVNANSDCNIIHDMLLMGVDSLELALRRLQYELEILAHPLHQELAEMVFFV